MNTVTGRFLSEDPFWGIHNMQLSPSNRMQSGNLFAFVKNNPIMWVDPTGLSASSIFHQGERREVFCPVQERHMWTTTVEGFGQVGSTSGNSAWGNLPGVGMTRVDSSSSSTTASLYVPGSGWNPVMTYVPGNGWHILAKPFIKPAVNAGRYVLLLPAVQSTLQPVKMHAYQFQRLVQQKGHATVTMFRNNFTPGYFRANLEVLTRQQHGRSIEAHHVLPQADRFAQHFNRVGLNINDPRFGSWVDATAHRRWSYQYNRAWDAFFAHPTERTRTEILNHARDLAVRFGFRIHF